MRRAILGPPLAELGADQLGHLELHQLRRDGLDRLADHLGVLIEQNLPDDPLDRHPLSTGHAAPPIRRTLRSPTIFSAASAGTTFRPTPTYTTLRDVTQVSAVANERPCGGRAPCFDPKAARCSALATAGAPVDAGRRVPSTAFVRYRSRAHAARRRGGRAAPVGDPRRAGVLCS